MPDPIAVTTLLFTDIEGSSLLWEKDSDRMRVALARHDAILRGAVEISGGTVVKMLGDGMYAAFDRPLDAIDATIKLQQGLADPEATNGISLRVRCGLHLGAVERRENDYFGAPVNRTARLMGAAHGGQAIMSQAVADLVANRLPQGVSLRDLGAVRLKDLARPERVYQLLHPCLRQDFPALRSLEATPNNLPQQMTSFVGREHAVAEARDLLTRTRLLTLVGVGGLGKTRLSLQVGAEVLDDFPDGVWFVELAPVSDAPLVPQVVASVLGLKEEAGCPVQETLLKFVKDRRLLLILDNCEHLVQSCAELAHSLLQAGPGAKVLASSRTSLRLMGEATYQLAPLAVPDLPQRLPPALLVCFDGVRLFVERAVAAQPAFRVTGDNAAAVAEICHRLDGIPLALELAAARVRMLTVEQIASRLSDRFRMLTGGDRTAMPRQQSLRACLDWSYDLLTRREQTLFCRLSIFAGGWTLEAAEAVCAGGDLEAAEVVDLLINLVEQSWVAVEAQTGRYLLLETVRQYALEQLGEAAEQDHIRSRHLAYYAAVAEKAIPELVGPRPGERLATLDPEQKNILAAYAWPGRGDVDAELGLRLGAAACHIWTHRGPLAVGYRMTMESLRRPRAQKRNLARCRALAAASQLGVFLGLHGDARRSAEESLAIAREIGDKGRVAIALQLLGIARSEEGDRATALEHFEESLALMREVGPTRRVAAALQNLAQWHQQGGNLDAAESLLEQSLALVHDEAGRTANTAAGRCSLAEVLVKRCAYERARAMLIEAMDIATEIGSNWAEGLALNVAVQLAASTGDWDRAARFIGASEALSEETGLRRSGSLDAEVRNALDAGAFDMAKAAGRVLSHAAVIAEVRAWLEDRTWAAPTGQAV